MSSTIVTPVDGVVDVVAKDFEATVDAGGVTPDAVGNGAPIWVAPGNGTASIAAITPAAAALLDDNGATATLTSTNVAMDRTAAHIATSLLGC